MISHRKQYIVWLLYLPIAIALIYLLFDLFRQGQFLSVEYLLLLGLGIFVAVLPVKTEDKDFSLTKGVATVTLVRFGLAHELLLSTISMIVMMRRLRVEWDQHYRYPLNLLAVSVQSVISALAYYNIQNELGAINPWLRLIISLTVYVLIHSLVNHLNMFLAGKYFYGVEEVTYINKNLLFSFKTDAIFLAIAVAFLYLSAIFGIWGQLIGMLLFTVITINLNYYYGTKRNNKYLVQVNQHVNRLNKKLSSKHVIHSFITSLLEIFPIDKVYYFKVEDDHCLKPWRIYYNKDRYENLEEENIFSNNSNLIKTLIYQKINVYHRAEEWLPPEVVNDEAVLAESAMSIPVHILGNNKGVILLVNEQRSAYTEFIVSLVEVFYQYFISVLHNADQYEQLENSVGIDDLTQLANFRGFSEKVKKISERKDFSCLSIIILDLDFFKKVNDTHGHSAGNEVLIQMAHLLEEFENEDRFITRYGGEEFIILLRNHSKEEAARLAEEIREAIAEKSFYVNHSIVSSGVTKISLTASFGVATYPDDTSDIYKLVLLADGVMYKKSKEMGRNKVAVFAN